MSEEENQPERDEKTKKALEEIAKMSDEDMMKYVKQVDVPIMTDASFVGKFIRMVIENKGLRAWNRQHLQLFENDTIYIDVYGLPQSPQPIFIEKKIWNDALSDLSMKHGYATVGKVEEIDGERAMVFNIFEFKADHPLILEAMKHGEVHSGSERFQWGENSPMDGQNE